MIYAAAFAAALVRFMGSSNSQHVELRAHTSAVSAVLAFRAAGDLIEERGGETSAAMYMTMRFSP